MYLKVKTGGMEKCSAAQAGGRGGGGGGGGWLDIYTTTRFYFSVTRFHALFSVAVKPLIAMIETFFKFSGANENAIFLRS